MITPESYAKDSEESHQIALFMWAALPEVRSRYPELRWLAHVPNGGQRSKSQGARLKAGGVKPGVPDLILPLRKILWAGLWIELKKPTQKPVRVGSKGGVSDEQSEWIAWLRSQGYACMVAYGWLEARDCLVQYLEWKE